MRTNLPDDHYYYLGKRKETKQNNQKNGRFLHGMGLLLCALSMEVEDWVLWELSKNERYDEHSLTHYLECFKKGKCQLVGCLFACLPHNKTLD